MKIFFATIALAYAQDTPRVANEPGSEEEEKAAANGSCLNNNNCFIAGRNDNFVTVGPLGACYCDAACHTTFNDCCADMEYQCYNGVADLCPSEKCYSQSTKWNHGEDPATAITCDMDNADCLTNTCDIGSMTVSLDTQLFHANSFIDGKFVDLLAQGKRTLKLNGNALNAGDWTQNGDIINVNVNYANLAVQPSWEEGANGKPYIVYTAQFTSAGNDDDDSDMIEFFVDHTVDATCKYEADVKIDADGFWVNQEDVVMNAYKESSLLNVFDCKFFEDSARTNQIQSHNIVNMGEMLYATVDSNEQLFGLGYELVSVVVSDPKDASNVFDVTTAANAGTVNYTVTPSNSKQATGSDIFFEYLSFGFETYGTPNGNQNELKVQCNVELYIL